MGQQVVATRKLYAVYHTIKYSYGLMSSRQFRIIEDHFRLMDGGKTSFYVVDWGDPRPISSITGDRVVVNNVQGFTVNSGDGGNRLILWQNSGDYGDNCTASLMGSGSYVLIDTTKAWDVSEWQDHQVFDSVGNRYNASDNTSNRLTITTASTVFSGAYDIYRYESNTASVISTTARQIIMSASPEMTYTSPVEKFVLPVYECYFAQDSLGIEPSRDDFNLEPNDNYGPFYSGSIEFIQKGTGT